MAWNLIHLSVAVHLVDVQYFIVRTSPQRFPFAMSHLEGFVLYALKYQITVSMCVFAI